MSQQEHDSADLLALSDAMTQMADFTSALESHAQGAAHALAGSWRGIASAEFVALVGIWGAGASALRQGAVDLSTWAQYAATTYDAAQDSTRQMWTT